MTLTIDEIIQFGQPDNPVSPETQEIQQAIQFGTPDNPVDTSKMGQYAYDPETDQLEYVSGPQQAEYVRKRFEQGWISPTIDILKTKGAINRETGKSEIEVGQSVLFSGRSKEEIEADKILAKYDNDPFKALANGVPESVIQAARFDLRNKNSETGKTSKEWYNDLSEADKLIVKTSGIKGLKEVQQSREEEQKKKEEDFALSLKRIEDVPGVKDNSGKEPTYNLVIAINGGISEEDIIKVFGKEALENAKKDKKDYEDFTKDKIEDPTEPGNWYYKDWVEDVSKSYGISKTTLEKVFKESGMAGINNLLGSVEYEKSASESESNRQNEVEFKNKNIEIAPGKWIDKNSYENLPQKEQEEIKIAYNTSLPEIVSFKYNSKNKKQSSAFDTIATSETSIVPDLSKNELTALTYAPKEEAEKVFLQSPEKDQKLYISGLLDKNTNYNDLSSEEKEKVISSWQNYVNYVYNPGKLTGKDYLGFVPIVGTYISIKDRGFVSGWTIASAVGDALMLNGAIKGASAGARISGTPGRIPRLKLAAKGAESSLFGIPESKEAVIQSIKQPLVETVDIFRPNYIPLSGIETSSGTIRLPISVAGSPDKAMIIRDLLMTKLSKGENPAVKFEGETYILDQATIKGLAHTSPDITFLKKGATVEENIGKGKSEQGLFLGSGIHSRFVPSSAFGKTGEHPGAAIFGKTGKKSVSSEKIYSGTAEMESKLPVGTEIPEMKSIGYSRTASGLKFELLSENDLKTLQRIAVKLKHPYTDVRSIYTPAIKVSGKNIKNIDLLEEASRYDRAAEKAEGIGDFSKADKFRKEAQSLREERLSRPLDRGAARTMSAEFSSQAKQLERESNRLQSEGKLEQAKILRNAVNRLNTARTYLSYLSRNSRALDNYNRQFNLSYKDRFEVSRIMQSIYAPNAIPTTVRVNDLRTENNRNIPRTNVENVPVYRPTIRTSRVIGRVTSTPRYSNSPNENTPKLKLPNFEFPDGKKLGDTFGSIAWYQGSVGNQSVWYVVKYPYNSIRDVVRIIGDLPKGVTDVKKGKGAAIRSIQTITGTPPDKLMVDLGIQDINIRYPLGKGNSGTILFTRDSNQKTRGDITIKKGSVKSIRVKKIQSGLTVMK